MSAGIYLAVRLSVFSPSAFFHRQVPRVPQNLRLSIRKPENLRQNPKSKLHICYKLCLWASLCEPVTDISLFFTSTTLTHYHSVLVIFPIIPSLSLPLKMSIPSYFARLMWLFLKLSLTSLFYLSASRSFLPRFHQSVTREEQTSGLASVIGRKRQHPQFGLSDIRLIFYPTHKQYTCVCVLGGCLYLITDSVFASEQLCVCCSDACVPQC